MDENLAQIAINLALKCKWEEAILINNKILKKDITDIESLNRLAKAYYELGNIKKAKSITLKVLKIDRANKIANKAIERYTHSNFSDQAGQVLTSDFLEVAGKTKLTTLINLGSEKTYSSLRSGEEVFIMTHTHKVSIVTADKKYVGKLTDDIASRLRKLIKGGNKYKVLIKSVEKTLVKVFIKETQKGKEFQGVLSFTRDQSGLESSGEFSS